MVHITLCLTEEDFFFFFFGGGENEVDFSTLEGRNWKDRISDSMRSTLSYILTNLGSEGAR